MPLQAGLEPLGERIILRFQRLPDGIDGPGIVPAGDVHMPDSPIRFAGPERNVIEGKHGRIGAAVDHGADAPVADRQRLLEVLGRTVILQHQRPRRFRHRRALPAPERQQQYWQQRQNLFHTP